jgi:hypothetical protein
MFEDRLRQVDFRFTRNFQAGRSQVRANFDVFNLFNAGNVLRLTDRYGTSWLNAVAVMGGRLIKVSAQLDFQNLGSDTIRRVRQILFLRP